MPTSDRVLGAGAWLLETSHRTVLALTGGRFPKKIAGMQTVEIHVKGRKSGLWRRTALIYGRDGDNYVVVASKGGSPTHPLWYLNLRDNPESEIQVGPDKVRVRARDAEGEERARLWQTMSAIWPDYNNYQKKTDRQIPVVVLEPVS